MAVPFKGWGLGLGFGVSIHDRTKIVPLKGLPMCGCTLQGLGLVVRFRVSTHGLGLGVSTHDFKGYCHPPMVQSCSYNGY